MVNTILLSFVIPVYNVEQYLNECIDSIRDQMTNQCEIILVNDGSTDLSGEICKKYSNIDSRIKTIDQKNQGAAVARNTGLLYAQGKYVTFVDSDDRIAKNSIGKILSWINNNRCDVCFLQISKLYPDGTLEDMGDCIIKEQIKDKTKEEVLAHLASRPKFSGSACNKIYKTTFLQKCKIRFPEDGLVGEDLVFMRDVFLNAEHFDLLEFPYYEYRQSRVGSVTHVFTLKNFLALARFVEESTGMLTNNRMSINTTYGYAMSFVAYEYAIILWQHNYLLNADKKAARHWLTQYSWVLQYSLSKKCKAIHLCVQLLGIQLTSKLLNLYMNCSKTIKRH